MDGLILTPDQLLSMRTHVQALAPLEACGLLAAPSTEPAMVARIIPVTNQAHSLVRFAMDPLEQIKAFDWIDRHEMQLVGIFHSHPRGPQHPSPTDIREAAYDVVHVIWSRRAGTWKPRAYRIGSEHAREVALQVLGLQ